MAALEELPTKATRFTCPFCSQQTVAQMVDPDRKTEYHCYSCSTVFELKVVHKHSKGIQLRKPNMSADPPTTVEVANAKLL